MEIKTKLWVLIGAVSALLLMLSAALLGSVRPGR